MATLEPLFEGLDQNYDFIYEALLEGATVYLRISEGDFILNCLVTSWLLDPGYGLFLYATPSGASSTTEFVFTNGSYHTASEK